VKYCYFCKEKYGEDTLVTLNERLRVKALDITFIYTPRVMQCTVCQHKFEFDSAMLIQGALARWFLTREFRSPATHKFCRTLCGLSIESLAALGAVEAEPIRIFEAGLSGKILPDNYWEVLHNAVRQHTPRSSHDFQLTPQNDWTHHSCN
jgi:hypothetical protein